MKRTQNYNIDLSMDDLKNDKRSERITGLQSIYTQATTAFVLVFIFYKFLLEHGILGKTGYIRSTLLGGLTANATLNGIIDFVIENILLALLFYVILLITRHWTQRSWIRQNAGIWMKGDWLHIHLKANGEIRVGYVKMTQSFDDVNAEAINYDAQNPEKWNKITTWGYYNARVTNEDLRGFYHASKGNQVEENSGMHTLKITIRGPHDYPVVLRGKFSDIHNRETAEADLTELQKHSGTLTLVRMSKALKARLFEKDSSGRSGEFSSKKFKQLIEDIRTNKSLNDPELEEDRYIALLRQTFENVSAEKATPVQEPTFEEKILSLGQEIADTLKTLSNPETKQFSDKQEDEL